MTCSLYELVSGIMEWFSFRHVVSEALNSKLLWLIRCGSLRPSEITAEQLRMNDLYRRIVDGEPSWEDLVELAVALPFMREAVPLWDAGIELGGALSDYLGPIPRQ